jgi:hypothetical protein
MRIISTECGRIGMRRKKIRVAEFGGEIERERISFFWFAVYRCSIAWMLNRHLGPVVIKEAYATTRGRKRLSGRFHGWSTSLRGEFTL